MKRFDANGHDNLGPGTKVWEQGTIAITAIREIWKEYNKYDSATDFNALLASIRALAQDEDYLIK